jgi:hypothetical protein
VAGLFSIDNALADCSALEERIARPTFDGSQRTTDLIIGARNLRPFIPVIRELRVRCGQQEDLTTDPQYFIAANSSNRRVAAVLIYHHQELEGCVFFFEHYKFGIGLGIMRGGGRMGESLVAGPAEFRLQYVHLAAQSFLQHRGIHGVSISVRSPLDACLEVMGPESRYRIFSERNIQFKLPLQDTYRATLDAMGPRTRRSLAAKRKQLQTRAHVTFLPSLEPAQALEAMMSLRTKALAKSTTSFCRARHRLLEEAPNFFCMGLRLPDGAWLSMLSGWRLNRVTYVDLQMNDMHFKQESISAVMRAFMLDHEIEHKQELIHFVGGTSLLLRRYCQPIELCTDAFIWRPCLRAALTNGVIARLKPKGFYALVKDGTEDRRAATTLDDRIRATGRVGAANARS